MTKQTMIDIDPATGARQVLPQVGALCWRLHGGRARILLVTSRDTGRWVIPKGWPMDGRSPDQAAAQEAWEEAGVEGRVQPVPLGLFSYLKLRSGAPDVTCTVTVHALRVDRLLARFPERGQRRRKWFDAEKAARKVAEPGLRALILRFAETARDGALPAPASDAPPAGD